jgi:hypothetical protein
MNLGSVSLILTLLVKFSLVWNDYLSQLLLESFSFIVENILRYNKHFTEYQHSFSMLFEIEPLTTYMQTITLKVKILSILIP